MHAICGAYRKNLMKATLPGGSGWVYHHDDLHLEVHKRAKHPGMNNDMEFEDYLSTSSAC